MTYVATSMSFQNITSCEGITNSGNTILFLLKVFIAIFLQDMLINLDICVKENLDVQNL